jgi:hypothetical protein
MKVLAPILMVVGGLLSLAWIGGWFYVAYHFIVKYW